MLQDSNKRAVLNKAIIGKTKETGRGDNEMVEQFYIHYTCRLFKLAGKFPVCSAGLQVAGRMVMCHNDLAGILEQCIFEYQPDICNRTGKATAAYYLLPDEPVGVVEINDTESLMVQILQ